MAWTFNLDNIQVVSLFVGVILPILVGLVTKKVTSSAWKATLLALLSAVSGVLTEWISHWTGGFDLGAAVLTWLATFMIAVATHFGFWKPTGVTDAAQNSLNK